MQEKLGEALIMMVVGLGAVFTVLSFFSLLIWLINKIEKKFSKVPVERPILKVQKEFFETKTESELVAVITAAAMQCFGSKIKVHKIHFLDDHSKQTGWANSGRINVMGSHSINKKG